MAADPPTVQYRPDNDESLSTAIMTAISTAKGRDVSEDECVLYESIEPDALDGLFRERGGRDTVKVEFATHDAIVIVWGNGDICIEVQDLEANPDYG